MVRVERLGVRSKRAVTARRMVCSVCKTVSGGRQETRGSNVSFTRCLAYSNSRSRDALHGREAICLPGRLPGWSTSKEPPLDFHVGGTSKEPRRFPHACACNKLPRSKAAAEAARG